ncbi:MULTISPECIES: PqqD family protein [Desulfosediminicola]|uniref:PqqD family protein n=1 Tax=Desulfosediminicola TaxID=2886823 RepID=UPI0010AD0512|nr:PqqD family protein [Desulfosediminicola ganghwensis]
MKIRRSDNYVGREVAGEFLLIPITTVGADLQKIKHLNGTAAAIWDCLDTEKSQKEVLERLSGIYNVEDTLLKRDVRATFDSFVKSGICIVNE